MKLQRGEGGQLLAQDRLEYSKPHLEAVDVQADGGGNLATERLVEVEILRRGKPDESGCVADAERRDLYLHVLDGGEIFSDLDVRDGLQAQE